MSNNESFDVFIAYYGNESSGTEKKARLLCRDLNSIVINNRRIKAYCKPEIDTVGAFSNTPRIVQRTPLFLLVVDKEVPRNEHGQLQERDSNNETKQLYLEVEAFRSSESYKKADNRGMVAKLFIVDDLSYEEAGKLDPIFSGTSQFKESVKGYSNTVDEVANWIIQTLQKPEEPSAFFSQIWLFKELESRDNTSKYIENITNLYRYISNEYSKIPNLLGNDIDHSPKHIKRILDTIYSIIENDISGFSDIELTVIITSVLIHDISLCVDKKDIETLEENDTINGSGLHLSTVENSLFHGDRQLAITYIFERTRDLRMEETLRKLNLLTLFNGIYENYLQDILQCVQIHDQHFGNDCQRSAVKNLDGQKLDLPFITVLLHLGDILDYDISGTSEERNLFSLSTLLSCSDSESGIPSLVISNIDKKIRKSTSLNYVTCESCERCPMEVYIQAINYNSLRRRIKNEFRNIDREKYNYIQCRICEYVEYLEREIKKCKRILENGNSIHRLNIEDSVKYINPEPVKPNHRIDIDYSTTVSLLLGEHIYGSRRVGLREIIQNSIDACKYRLARTKTKHAYKPSISILLDKLNNEITIEDNGIGMDRFVIENYFLKIGQSLYGSEIYQESDYQFYHAGHYGIGFFAAFMLSESVLVETRHMDDSASWSVQVSSNGRYASITQLEKTREIGTTITLDYSQVEKNLNIYNTIDFDLLYEIKSYIARFFLSDIQKDKNIEITIDDISDTTDKYRPRGSNIIKLESINDLILQAQSPHTNYYNLSKYLVETQCVIETDQIQDYQWYKYVIENGVESFVRSDETELSEFDSVIYKKVFHQDKCVCLYIPTMYWVIDSDTGYRIPPFNYDEEDRQAAFATRTEKIHGSITIKELFNILGWQFPDNISRNPITAFIGKYCVKKINNNVILYLENAAIEHREPNEGATLNGRKFRDEIYIRNVYIPEFHIRSPFTLVSINEKHMPEIKKMIMNIDREGVYPDLDRNTVSDKVKNEISQAACLAILKWASEYQKHEESFELWMNTFFDDCNNTFFNK